MGTACANHPDRAAVGNCSYCHRYFCVDCLGLDDQMKPICGSCENKLEAGEIPSPGSGASTPEPAALEVVSEDKPDLAQPMFSAGPTPKAALNVSIPEAHSVPEPASSELLMEVDAEVDLPGVLPTAPAPPAVPTPFPRPAAKPAPASAGSFDVLKHKVVDDDPLGLFSASAATPTPPAASPEPAVRDSSELSLDEVDEPQKPPVKLTAPPPASSILDDLLSAPVSPKAFDLKPAPVVPPAPAVSSAGPMVPPSPTISTMIPPSPAIPPSPVMAPKPSPIAPLPLSAVSAPLPKPAPVIPLAPVTPPITASPAPKPASSGPASLDDLFGAPIAKPKVPVAGPVTTPKVNLTMDPGTASAPVRPPLPTLSPKPVMPTLVPTAALPSSATPTGPSVLLPDEDLKPKSPGFLAGLKSSSVTLFKFKVPYYAVAAGLLVLLGLVGLVTAAVLQKPSLEIVDTVTPLSLVQVDSSQITDMDITSYSDLQTHLQTMQFTSFLQMTIPQLPSPNFFNVQIKPDVSTYAEIIKMPGQLKPVLSFVTVFTNGVWYSTNAWDGQNQEMEYLVSEFDPGEDPDQLYVTHIQGIDKLKQDRGWETQEVNPDRYMAALTDHVRWYLNEKNIAAYQADFASWH